MTTPRVLNRVTLAIRRNWALSTGWAILVAMGWQIASVRQQNVDLISALRRDGQGYVRSGDGVGDLSGSTPDGQYVRYLTADGSKPTFVVAMSVECGYCDKNLGAWDRLSVQARRSGFQVVWVSRDPLRLIPAANRFDRSMIADPTHSTFVQLKLATVPQTMIINPIGRVTYARAGILDAETEGQIVEQLVAGIAR